MRVRVYGEPAPQGSKQGFIRGGRVNLVEASRKVKPWREAVRAAAAAEVLALTPKAAARRALPAPLDGPISVGLCFFLPRPKTVSRLLPWKKPDLDKLIRSTLDGLTDAMVWIDDAQVVSVYAVKLYAKNEPGVLIDFWQFKGEPDELTKETETV